MKKSTILFFGTLLGIIFFSGQLVFSSSWSQELDTAGPEEEVIAVKVFPNPSNGRFQLTIDYRDEVAVKAKVFDITGKVIKDITDDIQKEENSMTASVDLENPGSGIYFIRIELGGKLLTKKIIIR